MDAWNAFISILQATLVVLASSAMLWVVDRRRKHQLFKKLGVPGPNPDLLWGNWKQLQKNRLQVMTQWIQQYGKLLGFYFGDQPYMVITDTELIKECFVKPTKVFQDRPFYSLNAEPMASSMPLLTGERWRSVRAVFNACFTVGKVKDLSGTVDSSVDRFLQKLDNACCAGIPIDAFEASRALVLDMLTRAVLGWQVDCQAKGDDPALNALRTIFREADNTVFEGAFAYPGLGLFLRCIYPFSAFCKAAQTIMGGTLDIINQRRSGKEPRKNDVLQHIIDAQTAIGAVSTLKTASARSINDPTLMSNLGTLLLAGFDTTSTSLAFILYLLAKHPEEQKKIRAEIATRCEVKLRTEHIGTKEFSSSREATDDEGSMSQLQNHNTCKATHHTDFNRSDIAAEHAEVLKRMNMTANERRPNKCFETTDRVTSLSSTPLDSINNELDEDAIMNLERLDMVVREGLRLYPAIPVMIIRQCSENTTILGQFIPAGTTLVAPTWHVHRDPEIWPEAERFWPDRFSTRLRECSPSVYYPFGLGPRMCVAHRLGMVTLKKTLYSVLKRYTLTLDEDVPDPLPVVVHNVVLNPAAPMKIRLQPRVLNTSD